MAEFWTVDFVPLLAASLSALACALVGNLLVLTRRAMAADALSHAVVPGVVVAVAVTGLAGSLVVLAGGLAAAFAASGLVALLIRLGRVEPGTALGVVFTTFFAFGILVLEWSGLSRTGFDIHHVVTGYLEGLIWIGRDPGAQASLLRSLMDLPQVVFELAIVLVLVVAILGAFRKEFALLAFDPVFARASGLPVGLLEAALLTATALACTAAFKSVGVVLAVAMIVCPAATARLLTTRLPQQMALSAAIALGTVFVGYAAAVLGPRLFGSALALNAAGTIGAMAGLALVATAAMRGRA
ncbi:metal ABC transporter permease [Phreatobacter cathodiphilus]|uniref:Zinc ABC transporter permease n=1 Tax=Phreatobacter cathodiphilus TaxID=1868589 RepID=A0A2S0NGT1_9HYPH|nr:metal ABC transporter permease [Phreatobacter cathodiphilus]AVO47121.1 zinc ABC transporter permease [Phreatobacter cathodiphilus]